MSLPHSPPARWTPPNPVPGPVRTPRTSTRAYRPEDAPALFAAVNVDRAALFPWLPWAADAHQRLEQTQETLEAFRKRWEDAQAPDYVMGIFTPEGEPQQVLGGTGLHRIRAEFAEAEIGYWIRGDRHGKGLATEAVGALVTSAFDDWGFRRLRVVCVGSNVRSTAVARKLGFRLERLSKQARHVPSQGWQDELEFALLTHEWDRRRRRGPGGTSLDPG